MPWKLPHFHGSFGGSRARSTEVVEASATSTKDSTASVDDLGLESSANVSMEV